MKKETKLTPVNGIGYSGLVSVLRIIAVALMVCAAIAGAVLGFNDYGMQLTIAFAFWASGLISGMSLLGFAEIIKLLQMIQTQKYEVIVTESAPLDTPAADEENTSTQPESVLSGGTSSK